MLVENFMNIKTYILMILLKRDRLANSIIIPLVHILMHVIILELYVIYIMHVH